MSKKIQLAIADPCHENWDQMTQADKGRFCVSCQKQVIDFTNMSDSQLATFFKNPSISSVCGRLYIDQLNRDIEIPKKRIPWVKYFFQFALPAFLVSMKATAQGKVKTSKPRTEMHQKNSKDTLPVADLLVIPSLKISGVKNDLQNFKIIPGEILNSFYPQVNTTLSGRVGGISVSRKSTRRTNRKSKKLFEKNQEETKTFSLIQQKISGSTSMGFKIFPIPVQRNSAFSIELDNPQDETMQLAIISVNGAVVSIQSKKINKGLNRFSVTAAGNWSAGIYNIQLRNEKGTLVRQEKLVVQ